MSCPTRLLPVLLTLAATFSVPVVSFAQPGRDAGLGLQLDSAATGHTALEARGGPAGGFSVRQFGAKFSLPLRPLDQRWFPSVGLRYQRYDLDLDPGTPLPAHLHSLGLSLNLAGSLAPDWSFFGSVSPRLANAGDGFSSRGLGVGVIAIASRRFSPEFGGGFGFVYDSLARGTGRIIPVATFDWTPAPGWRVFLGFPRTGASWQVRADLKAEFVAEADFGSFHVADEPAPAGPGRPALDRTRLEYQAGRVGPALTWRASSTFSTRLAAGVVPFLNAEYRQRNYKLKSERTPGFASLELDWKF